MVVKALGEQEFDASAYIGAVLKAVYKNADDGPDWEILAEKACTKAKTTGGQQWLLGTFKHEQIREAKPVKERVVRQKDEQVKLQKPDNVESLEKNEKGAELVKIVLQHIMRACQKYGKIPYMQLITDPEDYMASVDNAFQLSFHVRDGAVGIEMGADNKPYVFMVSEENKRAKRDEPTVQGIMALSYAKWSETAAMLKGRRPLIDIDRAEFWSGEDEAASLTQAPSVSSQLSQMQVTKKAKH